MSRPSLLRVFGVNWRAAALVVLLGVLWAGLYTHPSPLRLVALGGLGLVTGVSVSRGGRAGVLLGVVALVTGLAVAAGHGVGTYFTTTGWSALASEMNAGFVEVAGARYPVAGPASIALGLVLLVLAAVVAFLTRKLKSASVAALAGPWPPQPRQSLPESSPPSCSSRWSSRGRDFARFPAEPLDSWRCASSVHSDPLPWRPIDRCLTGTRGTSSLARPKSGRSSAWNKRTDSSTTPKSRSSCFASAPPGPSRSVARCSHALTDLPSGMRLLPPSRSS
jgi:hypothetical protein